MSNEVTKEEVNKEYIRRQIALNTEKNDIEKRIRIIDSVVNNLQYNKQQSVYRTRELNKRKESKEKYVYRLKEVENELDQIIVHNLDEEIKKEILDRKCESAKNLLDEKKAKARKFEIKAEKRQQSQDRWKKCRKQDRKERYRNGGPGDYIRFLRICNSLPPYMAKNLSAMPNNKGYIFRGVHFYGDKPAEPGKGTILFEKRRNNIMYIHEISKTEHRIYEKRGKKDKKRKLISITPRKKKKNTAPNLMDFVKK
jgi:hypothetical protein